jgi:uncharacterized membrane protein
MDASPFPAAYHAEQWDEILPGSAQVMLDLISNETLHRRGIDEHRMEMDRKSSQRADRELALEEKRVAQEGTSQWFGAGIAGGVLLVGWAIGGVAGATLIGGSLATTILAFTFSGRHRASKGRGSSEQQDPESS